MKVYVSGPYTLGDPVQNVRTAIHAGDALLAAGHVPYIPHLTMLWQMVSPKTWEEWIAFDLVWVEACDVLLRLPGESKGADMEVAHAQAKAIPVVFGLEEFFRIMEG